MRRFSHRSSFNNRSSLGFITPKTIIGVALVIAGAAGYAEYYQLNNTKQDVRFTVTGKQTLMDISSDTDENGYTSTSTSYEYLIHTKNSENASNTYQIADGIFSKEVGTLQLFGQMEKNCTYEGTVYGWSNPRFDIYQKLLNAKELFCGNDNRHNDTYGTVNNGNTSQYKSPYSESNQPAYKPPSKSYTP